MIRPRAEKARKKAKEDEPAASGSSHQDKAVVGIGGSEGLRARLSEAKPPFCKDEMLKIKPVPLPPLWRSATA